MPDYYLEFEKPLKVIDTELMKLNSDQNPSSDALNQIEQLQLKKEKSLKKIFSNLSRWQIVQLARHPQRPYTKDYIEYMSPDFFELHGDRHFSDDSAVICGIASLGDQNVVYIGQQKGRNTKENLFRNFGMMRPDGYRKSLRIMKLAEKFNLPVISLIDTSGAYPGIGAEERGQGEAIARNLWEMSKLRVPIISVVIGEGASGGALGIGLCDRMLMLEYTWFSVISPEGCASILWHDSLKAKDAADAMQVAPNDLLKMGICDRVIKEPLGGAHRNHKEMMKNLMNILLEEIKHFENADPQEFLTKRISRYEKMGVFTEN